MSSSSSSSSASTARWTQPQVSCGCYSGPWQQQTTAVPPKIDMNKAYGIHEGQSLPYTQYLSTAEVEHLREKLQSIHSAITKDSLAYERLEHICLSFPKRISGSIILEDAFDWIKQTMQKDEANLQATGTTTTTTTTTKASSSVSIFEEEVTVPQWVRGHAWVDIHLHQAQASHAVPMHEQTTMHERDMHLTSVLSCGLAVGTDARYTDIAAPSKAQPIPLPHGVTMTQQITKDWEREQALQQLPLLVFADFDEFNAFFQEAEQLQRYRNNCIICFNCPFTSYEKNVQYRSQSGRIAQSVVGAKAVLVRSVAPFSLYTPHTGTMAHEGVHIPVICLTIEDAETIHRSVKLGKKLFATVYSSARLLSPRVSRNLYYELRGEEKPEEYVLLGAHLDAWDVGQGAHDDGQGCAVIWDVIRMLKQAGIKTKRSIRAILFTDEEVKSSGGRAYYEAHQHEMQHVQAAIETDLGVAPAIGFGFTGCMESRHLLGNLSDHFLAPYACSAVVDHGLGVDIAPMHHHAGVPVLLLRQANEFYYRDYFLYHHTDADTIDKIDKQALIQNQQTIAQMAVLLADIPQRLPHSTPATGAHS